MLGTIKLSNKSSVDTIWIEGKRDNVSIWLEKKLILGKWRAFERGFDGACKPLFVYHFTFNCDGLPKPLYSPVRLVHALTYDRNENRLFTCQCRLKLFNFYTLNLKYFIQNCIQLSQTHWEQEVIGVWALHQWLLLFSNVSAEISFLQRFRISAVLLQKAIR